MLEQFTPTHVTAIAVGLLLFWGLASIGGGLEAIAKAIRERRL